MAKTLTNFKGFQCIFVVNKIFCRLFHTSRKNALSLVPNITSGIENNGNKDVLKCFRSDIPSSPPATDESNLAGDPRCVMQSCQGVKSDIFEKWNQTPKRDTCKKWAKDFLHY